MSWCVLFVLNLGGGLSLASKLRSLSSESFVQLLGAIFKIVQVMYTSLVSSWARSFLRLLDDLLKMLQKCFQFLFIGMCWRWSFATKILFLNTWYNSKSMTSLKEGKLEYHSLFKLWDTRNRTCPIDWVMPGFFFSYLINVFNDLLILSLVLSLVLWCWACITSMECPDQNYHY